MPPSQQLEGVDASVMAVVPTDVEPPGAVEFGTLDTERHRAVRTGPALFSPRTDVGARRTRAPSSEGQQVELCDVAIGVGHSHVGVLGDVDRFGLMTLVHGVALQVRRRSSDDRRDNRFPFNTWLAPHCDEVVDAEDCRNSASGEHGLGERHTDRGFRARHIEHLRKRGVKRELHRVGIRRRGWRGGSHDSEGRATAGNHPSAGCSTGGPAALGSAAALGPDLRERASVQVADPGARRSGWRCGGGSQATHGRGECLGHRRCVQDFPPPGA